MKSCIILAASAYLLSMLFSFGYCAMPEDTGHDPCLKFNEASLLYSESRFEESLRLYEEIEERGYESAALYYNLGNTYIKIGNLGKAILYYERAMRFAPYDSDLKSNIRYVNSLKRQPVITLTASSWISRKTNAVLSLFTVDGLSKLLSAVYIIALFFLGIAVFRPGFMKFARRAAIVLAIVFMIAVTALSFKIYQTEYIKSAIVLGNIVDARYEPLLEAPVHFKLYEGTKIVVLRTRGDWSQVKREDNKIGWIQSGVYGII